MKSARATVFLAASVLLFAAAPTHALTLRAAWTRTLENSPAIQQAKNELEAASGRRLVFRASAFPDARVGIAIGAQGGKRAGEDPFQPFGFARGAWTQPLFNASVPAAFRRGNVEVLIAQQQLNVAVATELHAVRTAFYGALYNESLRTLREDQRLQLRRNFAGQNSRYNAGNTERGVVAAAGLLEQELAPRLEETRRSYEAAILTVAQKSGANLGPGAQLDRPEGELQFALLDRVPGRDAVEVARDRPDLKLARLLVQAAGEDQRIIEAAYYPEVNAVISGDYIPVSGVRRGSEGSPRRSDDIISSELRIGVAFTWRVVDNGKTGGAVLRQRSVHEINALFYKKLEENVPREFAQIDTALAGIAARHRAMEGAARAAQATAAAVQENLAQGVSSQLDFRTAETNVLETKSGLLRLAYEQNMALAEWDRAAGRYFQFLDASSTNVH